MRKGFTITPILFVGLILITGLMLLNFTDLDRRVSEGISKETQLNKLHAALMENQTNTETLLLFHSANESTYSSTRAGLESAIGSRMGGTARIVSCLSDRFTVEFNETFYMESLDATANSTYSARRTLDCARINGLTDRNATVSCGSVTLSCLGA
jgi:hypothetical protein